MLDALGFSEVMDLFADLPAEVRLGRDLNLPLGMPELELDRHVRSLADKNRHLGQMPSFLGAGAYDRFIPAAFFNDTATTEIYTSYTPYQPEVSQGTLQAIWEFQSLVAALYEMDVAQASLYDGATAAAEAMMVAVAETGRQGVVVARSVDPQVRSVIRTYAQGRSLQITELALDEDRCDLLELDRLLTDQVAVLIVQQPSFLGAIEPVAEMVESAHRVGALAVVIADPIAHAWLKPPGAYGADLAVGEGQGLGVAPSFGGPYVGLMAARQGLVRRLPGRIVGRTVDVDEKPGFVLTLQTREQHIRRQRATSNICTNQGLIALAATVYMSLVGPEGLRQVALLSHEGAEDLKGQLLAIPGVTALGPAKTFYEFAIRLPKDAREVNRRLLADGFIGGYALAADYPELGAGSWLLAVTEKRTKDEIAAFAKAVADAL